MLRRNALKVWRHQQAHGLLLRAAEAALCQSIVMSLKLTGGDLGALALYRAMPDPASVSLAVKPLKAEAPCS